MGQNERQPLGIVDSTVVGLWLPQSHLSSYLLRDTTQHRDSESRGRDRETYTDRERKRLRTGEARKRHTHSHPKSKRAHTNHREGKSTPGFSLLTATEKKRESKSLTIRVRTNQMSL